MYNPAKPLQKRPDGKLVLSGTTNEIVQAVNDMMPKLGTGFDPRAGYASSMVILSPQGVMNGRAGFYFAKPFYGRSAVSSTVTTAIGTNDFGTISGTPSYLLMNAGEINGGTPLASNTATPAIEIGFFTSNSQSYTLAVAISSPSPSLFRVLAQWDGTGSSGDGATFCTFAYNLYALSDNTLTIPLNTTGLQPTNSSARNKVGRVTIAPTGSSGWAYYGSTGTLILYSVQETRNVLVCS